MADRLDIDGTFVVTPSGTPSLELTPSGTIDETLQLTKRSNDKWDLSAAVSQVISFGPVTDAHVVKAKTVGGEIILEITTAEGTDQTVPVDSVLILISETNPVTAIKATGTGELNLFLGEK